MTTSPQHAGRDALERIEEQSSRAHDSVSRRYRRCADLARLCRWGHGRGSVGRSQRPEAGRRPRAATASSRLLGRFGAGNTAQDRLDAKMVNQGQGDGNTLDVVRFAREHQVLSRSPGTTRKRRRRVSAVGTLARPQTEGVSSATNRSPSG